MTLGEVLNTIQCMEARQYCQAVPPGIAHVMVTSPPYYRQRVYEEVEPVIWGGSIVCTHDWAEITTRDNNLSGGQSEKQLSNAGSMAVDYNDLVLRSKLCPTCGAWLGCLGNEPTPEMYIDNLCEVFRGIWRVLRDDGIAWLNLDGKYNGSGGAGGDYNKGGRREGQPKFPRLSVKSYKAKDWIPIPWLAGIALQKAGWYLRCDRIWDKPNGFVTSAKDRPTRTHEYILMLTKRARYYYDYDGVSEPAKYAGDKRSQRGDKRRGTGMNSINSDTGERRNSRSVMRVTTKPTGVEHYAAYNTELIDPLIIAGCPQGGVVFDPFMGVGTTARATAALGRNFIGCDASPKYVRISNELLAGTYQKESF